MMSNAKRTARQAKIINKIQMLTDTNLTFKTTEELEDLDDVFIRSKVRQIYDVGLVEGSTTTPPIFVRKIKGSKGCRDVHLCPLCDRTYIQRNRRHHNKTKHHMRYEKLCHNIAKILLA